MTGGRNPGRGRNFSRTANQRATIERPSAPGAPIDHGPRTTAAALLLVFLLAACTYNTPLMEAAVAGDTAAMEKRLAAGAAIDERTFPGTTALMIAAAYGPIDTVRLLLERGAQVTLRDDLGHTALAWAVVGRKPEAVALLLNNGAQVDSRNRSGLTPLMLAAMLAGPPQTLKTLLQAGADVNARSEEGFTALIGAANQPLLENVALLLENGADVKPRLETTQVYYHVQFPSSAGPRPMPGQFTQPRPPEIEKVPAEFFWEGQNALAIAEDASHCSEFSGFISAATGDRAGARRERRICGLYDQIYGLLKKHGATK